MPASAPTPTTPASAVPAVLATRRGANGLAGWDENMGCSNSIRGGEKQLLITDNYLNKTKNSER